MTHPYQLRYQDCKRQRDTALEERDTARALAVRLEQELVHLKQTLFTIGGFVEDALPQLGETPAAPPPAADRPAPDVDSLRSQPSLSVLAAAELPRYLRATRAKRNNAVGHEEPAPEPQP
jgi:hypothetical protein